MVKVDILPTAQAAEGYDFSASVAVTIDVLRATSVISMAVNNGAANVIPVLTPEEGFTMAERLGRDNVILGGERNADRIPGFDLGNSPQDYTPAVVSGKSVIITTTNGTVALRNASQALRLFAASLLNLDAVAKAALSAAKECHADKIVFVCSGNYGKLTLEDCVCAAWMVDCVMEREEVSLVSDSAVAIHLLRGEGRGDKSIISRSAHLAKLLAKGYAADVEICLGKINEFSAVPMADSNGFLTLA